MRAILLAAGVGSRIQNEIGQIPKSLVKVGDKPLIVHTVELLQKNHIEVTIITGFKHKLIEDVLKGYHVDIFYNPFYRVTNSIGSLWYARKQFNTHDILIANADVYYTQELLDLIFDTGEDCFLLSDRTRAQAGDYFFFSENGILRKYGKDLKPEERNSEYVGLACIRNGWIKKFKKRLNRMIDDGEYDTWWESVLYSFAGEGEKVHTVDVEGIFWSEVDTIGDYDRVTAYVREKEKNG